MPTAADLCLKQSPSPKLTQLILTHKRTIRPPTIRGHARPGGGIRRRPSQRQVTACSSGRREQAACVHQLRVDHRCNVP